MNLHAPKGIDVENWFIECYRKYKGHLNLIHKVILTNVIVRAFVWIVIETWLKSG